MVIFLPDYLLYRKTWVITTQLSLNYYFLVVSATGAVTVVSFLVESTVTLAAVESVVTILVESTTTLVESVVVDVEVDPPQAVSAAAVAKTKSTFFMFLVLKCVNYIYNTLNVNC
jgi:hypothetical protein